MTDVAKFAIKRTIDKKLMEDDMDYRDILQEHFGVIIGKRLTHLHLACEMMMFGFEEYALHAQCLARIICQNDILVTTLDYQNWDGEVDTNNDERYFVEKYRDKIVGGTVISVNVSSFNDVEIILNNGIEIELINKNGYHHFDDECEQWRFFKVDGHSCPHITVYSKTVDISTNW